MARDSLYWKYERTLAYVWLGKIRSDRFLRYHDSRLGVMIAPVYNWLVGLLMYLCLFQVIDSFPLMTVTVILSEFASVLFMMFHLDLNIVYLLLQEGEIFVFTLLAVGASLGQAIALGWDYRGILMMVVTITASIQISSTDALPNALRLKILPPSYLALGIVLLVNCMGISFGWIPGLNDAVGFNFGDLGGISKKNVHFAAAQLSASYYFSLCIYCFYKFRRALIANRENHLLNISAPVTLVNGSPDFHFLDWLEGGGIQAKPEAGGVNQQVVVLLPNEESSTTT